MHEHLEEVLKYTSSKAGRIAAYRDLVSSYTSRDMHRKAFDAAFVALEEFGDTPFPRKPSKFTVVKCLFATKKLLKKYPMEKLNQLPVMDDPIRAIMMKIFIRLTAHAYLECRFYLPLIVFRVVTWSCIYGVSGASPPAFALYGLLLVGLGDLKGGTEFTEFATGLMEQSNDKSEYAFTNLVVTMVNGNQQPVSNCVKAYKFGYQVGMKKGDNFYGVLNMAQMLLTSLSVGRPLYSIASDMKLYIPHFVTIV